MNKLISLVLVAALLDGCGTGNQYGRSAPNLSHGVQGPTMAPPSSPVPRRSVMRKPHLSDDCEWPKDSGLLECLLKHHLKQLWFYGSCGHRDILTYEPAVVELREHARRKIGS